MNCRMLKKLARLLLLILMVFCFSLVSLAEETTELEDAVPGPLGDSSEEEILLEEAPEGCEGVVEIVSDAELEEIIADEGSDEPWAPDDLEKTIFGKDDRKVVAKPSAFPYSCIAYMSVYAECGCSWVGSGFMISSNCLLTAAHCLVCTRHSKWARSVDFYFGYKSARNCVYHYSGGWYAYAGDSFRNGYTVAGDYAAVKLNTAVGNRTGWFGSVWNGNPGSRRMNVAGYQGGKLRTASGIASLNGSNHLKYKIDTVPGSSGGPVFDSGNYVYGINIAQSNSYNFAFRLNNLVRRAWNWVKSK